MKISFIIPLFNCLPLTRECVATLQKSLPTGLEHEIILVDDGSTDGTREWLATLSHEFRVILNDSNLAIGNVQRRVSDRGIDHSGITINAKGKPEHDQHWYLWPQQQRIVPAVTGACLLIKRSNFLEEGGFDEAYFNGGEDVDLCFRLSEKRLINAIALRSTVLHHVSASPGRKARDESNSYLLASKWRPQLTSLAWRSWTIRYLAELMSENISSAIWKDVVSSLLYLYHFSSRAPQIAITGVEEVMNTEFTRWQALFAKDKITRPRSESLHARLTEGDDSR